MYLSTAESCNCVAPPITYSHHLLLRFRCAFHAYADSTYAKHLESGGGGSGAIGGQSLYGTIGAPTPIPMSTPTPRGSHMGVPMLSPNDPSREYQQSVMEVSEDSINSIEKVEEWSSLANGSRMSPGQQLLKQRIPNGGTPSPRENGKLATLFAILVSAI